MVEYLDIYDKEENYLGYKSREDCHKKGVDFYHRVVWIWIKNKKGEILIQQRALSKKSRPGCWEEAAVAGHVSKGESVVDACKREIHEELGIKVSNLELKRKWIYEPEKEIVYFFVAITNANKFALQKEEVEAVKYLPFDDYLNKLDSKYFGDYPEEYIDIIKSIL